MLKNLTPHPMQILRSDGSWLNLPKEDSVIPRCYSSMTQAFSIDGIEVFKTTFGQVENLPDPMDGVLLIVSRMVKDACPDRTDLVSAGELIRDKDGKIVGCRGLSL